MSETNMSETKEFKSIVPPNTWDWMSMKKEDFLEWHYGSDVADDMADIWKYDMKFSSVLDLGTGLGGNARQFAESGFKVHALDIDPVPLHIAKESSKNMTIEYKLGDMLNMPYKDNSFECVFAMNILCLTYSQGIMRTIDEIHRVLINGGEVFATLNSKEAMGYKEEIAFIDNNSVIGKAQFGNKPVPFYYVDKKSIPELFNGFKIIVNQECGYNFVIRARKNAERIR